jgi:hypothetical protein
VAQVAQARNIMAAVAQVVIVQIMVELKLIS